MLYTLFTGNTGGEGVHTLKPSYQSDTVTTGLIRVLAVTSLHFGQGPIRYPTVFLQTNTMTVLKISQDTYKTGYTSETCRISCAIKYNFNK
jgi:hypothetical protein